MRVQQSGGREEGGTQAAHEQSCAQISCDCSRISLATLGFVVCTLPALYCPAHALCCTSQTKRRVSAWLFSVSLRSGSAALHTRCAALGRSRKTFSRVSRSSFRRRRSASSAAPPRCCLCLWMRCSRLWACCLCFRARCCYNWRCRSAVEGAVVACGLACAGSAAVVGSNESVYGCSAAVCVALRRCIRASVACTGARAVCPQAVVPLICLCSCWQSCCLWRQSRRLWRR